MTDVPLPLALRLRGGGLEAGFTSGRSLFDQQQLKTNLSSPENIHPKIKQIQRQKKSYLGQGIILKD